MSGNRNPPNGGFTLVEILIVASLTAIISLAIYGALSAGVRLWKQMAVEQKSTDLMLGWKRLQKDVRGRLNYKAIPFVGEQAEMSFPALIPVQPNKNEVGRIRYYSDDASHSLCREKKSASDVLRETSGECVPVFFSVSLVSFEYYGQETKNEGPGTWRSDWDKDFPPLAVRLKMTLEGGVEKQFTTVLP